MLVTDKGEISLEAFSRAWRVLDRPTVVAAASRDRWSVLAS